MDETRLPIRWAHFSDLHVGVKYQAQLWPAFGMQFNKDLDSLLKRVGAIDAIIFSGDIVQQGAREEFDQFDKLLDELLSVFSNHQQRPQIISVPGNHDMVRPEKFAPESVALKQFWSDQEFRDGFWEKGGEAYREFLAKVFENYTDWRDRAIDRGVHVRPSAVGILPGDAAYLVQADGGQFGVVCLNATWLQLQGGNYEGQLHVDARQLLAVTGNRPDDWAHANEASLLVTHQPATWLHANKPSTWDADINPAGRFDAHLFGHMHQPETAATRRGGGPSRQEMQAASLFGLETWGDDIERIQGYSVSQIERSGSQRILRSWPRRLIETSNGRKKLDRDQQQDLDEDSGSFAVPYEVDRARQKQADHPLSAPTQVSSVSGLSLSPKRDFDISVLHLPTGEARAHKKVRQLEQETALHALASKRVIWLAADWGMGLEGFIGSIRENLNVLENCVLRLDFNALKHRDQFFDNIQTRFNVTFQQICEAVADLGPSILIFDDIEISLGAVDRGIEAYVEELGETVSEFASDAYVVLRSRRRPRTSSYEIVELRALDEPDLAAYVSESEHGARRYGTPEAAARLLRHTDGIPTRIDLALRDLEIVSLRELIAANPDFGDTGGSLAGAPPALVASVNELRQAENRAEQRAYDLLLALAALPQGEQLGRLKRFLGVHPIGLVHAKILLERSLIDIVGLTSVDTSADPTDKTLVVPRPVRDYVRETTDPETAWATDRKALELYFGEDWVSGSIRNSPTGKRARTALCDGYEIQNASTLIVRSARRSFDASDDLSIEAAIRLASAFIETLMDGDHFRAAASLCEDMVQLLEDYGGRDKELTIFNYEYGRSLRMAGRTDQAITTFNSLDDNHLTKSQRQQASLCLALSYETIGQAEEAARIATKTIAIDRRSNSALHAKVIIAEQIGDESERESELKKYLRSAETKKGNRCSGATLSDLVAQAEMRGWTTPSLRPHWTPTLEWL